MKKQEAQCGFSFQRRVIVHGNEKCDIRTNLNQKFINRVGFPSECPVKLYGDNKVVIHIVENTMFHERTKHIEVDCHIVR